jgi:uncharacterized protein
MEVIMKHYSTVVRSLFAGAFSLVSANMPLQAIPILSDFSTAYTQDFNTLANTGTSSLLPDGWASTDSLYTAGTGSSTTGDIYSLGTSGSSERALGGLQTGSLNPVFGAQFVNGTGQEITSLMVGFTGEQWRLGTAGRADRLDFQYSLDASSLTTGAWVDYDALDFTSPTTAGSIGALNGNTAANQQVLIATLSGLTVNPDAVIWIRWLDFNASGSDDVLAIDDFSIQAMAAIPSSVPDRGPTLLLLGCSLLPMFLRRRSFCPIVS